MEVNRFSPNRGQNTGGGAPASSSSAHMANPSAASKVMVVSLILASLAIFISIVAGAFGGLFSGGDRDVKDAQYQALFLTNGQVYFGRLSNTTDAYVELRDIYYLQVTQNGEVQEGANSAAADPQISLAKLGNELHGPEDVMYVSRDQVLFWENLKTDSQVVTAIQEAASGEKAE